MCQVPGVILWDLPTRLICLQVGASLVAQRLKRLPAIQESWVRSLGREDPLEREMATHSSILAWRIPWRHEPGRLQSTGSQRVRHDWATSLHFQGQKWGRRDGKKARAPSLTGFRTHHKDAGMHSRRGGGHDKMKMKIRFRSNGTLPTGY